MNATVQEVLDSFDSLSDEDQYEVAIEVLRRTTRSAAPELSDEAFVAAADRLFCELDAQEAESARSDSR